MKWKTALAVTLLLAAAAAQSFAQGPYVGASGGVVFTQDSDVKEPGIDATISYDTGYGFGLSAGYDFDGPRLELEYNYSTADMDSLDVSGTNVSLPNSSLNMNNYMVNAFYDFKMNSPITPFIGVGAGVADAKFTIDGESIHDHVLAYQGTIGAAYTVNKNLKLDAFYRFMGTAADFKVQGTEITYMSNNVFLGVRYNF